MPRSPKQRSRNDRSVAVPLGIGCSFRKLRRFSMNISQVNHPPLEHGAP